MSLLKHIGVCTKYILHTTFKMYFKYVISRQYEELLRRKKKREAAELLNYYEMEQCTWLLPRASRNLTKYTDDPAGFLGQFPMDILHTISKGSVPLLIEICDAYIEQSAKTAEKNSGAGGKGKKGKKGKKKKTKSQKRLGMFHACQDYLKCILHVSLKCVLNIEFDSRFAAMEPVRDPHIRMMHYRKFANGIADMSVFTADDCIALLQQLPYAVGTGNNIIPGEVDRTFEVPGEIDPETGKNRVFTERVNCNEAFVTACKVVTEILSILKKREVSTNDLDLLDKGWFFKIYFKYGLHTNLCA